MKAIDLAGQRFGRLLVLARAGSTPGGAAKWDCICDCGSTHTTPGRDLRSGAASSCGCLLREDVASRSTRHGMRYTKEYRTWNNMLQRTSNPNHAYYADYGGRGIAVCKEWLDFSTFISEMGACPDGCTLERVDNDLGYNKANCKWATKTTQARNTRRSALKDVGVGQTKTGRYYARITVAGKRIHLGTFDCVEDARIARKTGEATYWAA